MGGLTTVEKTIYLGHDSTEAGFGFSLSRGTRDNGFLAIKTLAYQSDGSSYDPLPDFLGIPYHFIDKDWLGLMPQVRKLSTIPLYHSDDPNIQRRLGSDSYWDEVSFDSIPIPCLMYVTLNSVNAGSNSGGLGENDCEIFERNKQGQVQKIFTNIGSTSADYQAISWGSHKGLLILDDDIHHENTSPTPGSAIYLFENGKFKKVFKYTAMRDGWKTLLREEQNSLFLYQSAPGISCDRVPLIWNETNHKFILGAPQTLDRTDIPCFYPDR